MKKLLFSILLMSPGIIVVLAIMHDAVASKRLEEIGATLGLIGVIILFAFGLRSFFDWYLERYG